MMSQLGHPIIFLTITITECKNPELLATLHKNAGMGDITPETAMRLPDAIKTNLVKNDPYTVVLYFEEKFKEIMKILQNKCGPFENHPVTEHYTRTEFQNRGSVHKHCLLYLENAPKYVQDDSNNAEVIKFIDTIITCKYDPKNPCMAFQRHKHTHTCYKGNRSKCRFNFPKYVMDETMILKPLPKDYPELKKAKENIKNINILMQTYFKNNIDISFDLKMDKREYIAAIRRTLKSEAVFLKRRTLDVAINQYNLEMLNLIQSNMDILE